MNERTSGRVSPWPDSSARTNVQQRGREPGVQGRGGDPSRPPPPESPCPFPGTARPWRRGPGGLRAAGGSLRPGLGRVGLRVRPSCRGPRVQEAAAPQLWTCPHSLPMEAGARGLVTELQADRISAPSRRPSANARAQTAARGRPSTPRFVARGPELSLPSGGRGTLGRFPASSARWALLPWASCPPGTPPPAPPDPREVAGSCLVRPELRL